MADEEIDDDLGASEEQKSSKIVTILLFVNLLISGFALFKILALPTEPSVVNLTAPEETSSGEDSDQPGPIHAFEPFLVNLNEPGGGRFLRVTVEIEVKDEEALGALQASERRVRDEVLRFLSNLQVDATLGENNRIRIRDGIISRVNPLLSDNFEKNPLVRGVYFPDFVVQ